MSDESFSWESLPVNIREDALEELCIVRYVTGE